MTARRALAGVAVLVLVFVSAAVALIFTSDSDSKESTTTTGSASTADLDAARARWTALGRDDYALEYDGPAAAAWYPGNLDMTALLDYRVTVADGRVVSAVWLDTGQPVPNGSPVPTVESVFATVERLEALASPTRALSVEYDGETGVPTHIDFDGAEWRVTLEDAPG